MPRHPYRCPPPRPLGYPEQVLRPLVALALALGALALSPDAAAHRVELAGKVTASRTVLSQRRVGEPRYVAISDLFYRDRTGYLEVLDLVDQRVIQITAKRSMLEKRFGAQRNGVVTPPQGEIVWYRPDAIGVALSETTSGSSRRFWYAELDPRTGRLIRSADLATLRDGEQLALIGADGAGDAAWFAITARDGRGRALVLRRFGLTTFEVSDEQRLPLPRRAAAGAREHGVQVHASADFSRFAVVEYVEDGVRMAPGHVYIVDPAAGTSFAIPAPSAAYGVAFSADGKYVYLASAQRGTITRVDVAGRRVDKQVAGPHHVHHLVISPGGGKLFALASSASYAVYDLPDLRARSDAPHPQGMAAAMTQLYGNGIASLDGAFFVVPEAEDRNKPARDRTYVIARLVD
jgi:hypothetical protein